MPKAPPLIRTGFTQGAKPSLDPSVVPPNALWRVSNARLNESGVIRLRPGTTKFNESLGTGHIQGLATAFGDIILVHNRDVIRLDGNGVATTLAADVIGASSASPVAVQPWHYEGEEAAFLFGGNGIYRTDGTEEGTELVTPYEPEGGEAGNLINNDGSQDITSGPAKCNIVLLRPALGTRFIATGNPDEPNTVYMSAPGRADYWPNDQWFTLPEGQPKITALALWYGAIIVFRDWDIWAYFKTHEGDDSNPGAIPQASGIGCAAGRTVVPVPGIGVVFLGGPQGTVDNVYTLTHVEAVENQVQAVQIGGDMRNPLVKAVREYGTEGASATYHDGEYYLSLPANLEEERLYRLDTRNRSGWFTDTGPRATQFLICQGELHAALWGEGRLVRFADALLDEERGIPFMVAFRREDLQPGPARIKRFFLYLTSKGRRIETLLNWWGGSFGKFLYGAGSSFPATVMTGTSQDLKVRLVMDGNTFEIDEFSVHAPRTGSVQIPTLEPVLILEARFRPSLKAHYVQVHVIGNTPEQDYAVIGYGIEYSTRGKIRGRREGVEQ